MMAAKLLTMFVLVAAGLALAWGPPATSYPAPSLKAKPSKVRLGERVTITGRYWTAYSDTCSLYVKLWLRMGPKNVRKMGEAKVKQGSRDGTFTFSWRARGVPPDKYMIGGRQHCKENGKSFTIGGTGGPLTIREKK